MAKPNIVDVIIPTYNGLHLLKKNLPGIIKNTARLNSVIIVDNGSIDGTSDWLKKSYPEVKVIKNLTNLGYTIPINQAVAVSSSEYFILINNDVKVEKPYLVDVFNYFKDQTIFAVTLNEKNSSWPDAKWSGGKMQFTRGIDKTRPHYSAWASGGSAIFNRKIWNKLGGLDEIYAPWYWEDIDIGYRAWKSGYKIIWDPKADVIHDHESTSKTLDQNYVNLIKQRNELLFNWLNIKDFTLTTKHFFFLFGYLLKHPGYIRVIYSAIFRMLTHRPLKRKFVVSDKTVLDLFSKPL